MTDDNDRPMQLVPAVSTVLKSKATSDMRGVDDDVESTSKLCPECFGVGGLIIL